MLLLKYICLTTLALFITDMKDGSLQVERAVPPAPISTTALGIATVEIRLNSATGALDTRVLYGEGPAVISALDALRHWRFKVAGTETARTSVTFVFRPPALYS